MNTSNSPIYEPLPEWQPLSQFIVTGAVEKFGNPFEEYYRLDSTTGYFVLQSVTEDGLPLGSDVFSLPAIVYGIYYEKYREELPPDRPGCGHYPDQYANNVIIDFWKQTCDELKTEIREKQVRLWGRNGGIEGEFRPVPWDIWSYAMKTFVTDDPRDYPKNDYDWLAITIFNDRLFTTDGTWISFLNVEADISTSRPDKRENETSLDFGPKLPPLQEQVLRLANQIWKDKESPSRISDRNNQLREAWPKGNTAPSDRTIARAFENGKIGKC